MAGAHTRAPPLLREDPQASRLTNPCSGSELPTPPPKSASERGSVQGPPRQFKRERALPGRQTWPKPAAPPRTPGSFLRRGRGRPSTPLSFWACPGQVRGARLTHLGAEARAREHTQSPGGEAAQGQAGPGGRSGGVPGREARRAQEGMPWLGEGARSSGGVGERG